MWSVGISRWRSVQPMQGLPDEPHGKPYAGNPHVRFDERLLARASSHGGLGSTRPKSVSKKPSRKECGLPGPFSAALRSGPGASVRNPSVCRRGFERSRPRRPRSVTQPPATGTCRHAKGSKLTNMRSAAHRSSSTARTAACSDRPPVAPQDWTGCGRRRQASGPDVDRHRFSPGAQPLAVRSRRGRSSALSCRCG